jgi:hypothetical protein
MAYSMPASVIANDVVRDSEIAAAHSIPPAHCHHLIVLPVMVHCY